MAERWARLVGKLGKAAFGRCRVAYRWLRGRQGSRLLVYVLLPLFFSLSAMSVLAFWVLHKDDPPPPQGISFDVDASGDFGLAASQITLEHVRRQPGVAPPLLPSSGTDLVVSANGCDRYAHAELSIFPDPRWWLALRASRRGETQRIAIRRGVDPLTLTARPGDVRGKAVVVIPGAVDHLAVYVWHGHRVSIPFRKLVTEGNQGEFTVLDLRIPDRAIEGVLLRSVIGQELFVSLKCNVEARREGRKSQPL
jgi:hypothetical protein